MAPVTGTAVVASTWSLYILACLFVGLRLWCKLRRSYRKTRGITTDDYVLTFGLLVLGAGCSVVTWMMSQGFATARGMTTAFFTAQTAASSLESIALAASKTAFSLMLVKITKGWQTKLVWTATILVDISYALTAIMLWRRPCTLPGPPGAVIERPNLPGSSCQSIDFSGILTQESTVLGLPWMIIRKLHLNKREKAGLTFAMSLGALAGVVTVVRLYRSLTNWEVRATAFISVLSENHIWAIVDGCATIIATTIPVLRVLVRDEFRERFSYRFSAKRRPNLSSKRGSIPMNAMRRDQLILSEEGQVGRDDSLSHTESLKSLKEPPHAHFQLE
ncbi:hypothetical protein MGN70_012955 [Eutypa lata]|nr:hypothetical protein MGN70_012955 [Eutypa lata]